MHVWGGIFIGKFIVVIFLAFLCSLVNPKFLVYYFLIVYLSLQARVADLQEYVEILKSELETSTKREKTRKVSVNPRRLCNPRFAPVLVVF